MSARGQVPWWVTAVRSGLHECPHCHYRFEDRESLERHLQAGCSEAP